MAGVSTSITCARQRAPRRPDRAPHEAAHAVGADDRARPDLAHRRRGAGTPSAPTSTRCTRAPSTIARPRARASSAKARSNSTRRTTRPIGCESARIARLQRARGVATESPWTHTEGTSTRTPIRASSLARPARRSRPRRSSRAGSAPSRRSRRARAAPGAAAARNSAVATPAGPPPTMARSRST